MVPYPALEEWRVVEMVRQAIQDPHSRPHRLVMQELFSRPDSRKDDAIYDIDVHKVVLEYRLNPTDLEPLIPGSYLIQNLQYTTSESLIKMINIL